PCLASSEVRHSLFAIPHARPFADDLAAGLLAGHPDPVALARVLLLLPTRRAIRALTEAFVRQADGRALLLPRMVPAGDIETDTLADWGTDPALGTLDGAAEAMPAIAPQARRLALARLLAGARRLPAAEALALANSLGAALDTLEIEGKRAADLAGAVPAGELQAHWQANAQVLEAVLSHWPALLHDRGLMDATRRRNLELDSLGERWAANPPGFPVLLAGFASAPPAVARVARTLLRLPQGRVVLPGLDLAMDADGWAEIAPAEGPGLETHPQHGMARLLRAAGVSPLEARPWPWASARQGSPEARSALVARALQPPALYAAPRQQALQPDAQPPESLSGLRMVEAATPAEEALLIAVALRQVVERPGLMAALVTPDRGLAARVSVQLKRFGIDIDDSAGEPLAASQAGSLMVALAAAAGEGFAPVALLGLLQHPLVQPGEARLPWLNAVRGLDLYALRKARPARGLSGITRRLQVNKRAPDDLKHWWTGTAVPLLAPLEPLPATAETLLDRLFDVARKLAGEMLWAGDSGRALARLVEALEPSRADLARLPVAP
ncbi:MAG: double-strand break repair protein AddB, partial [Sandaracinobacteroides sp.]